MAVITLTTDLGTKDFYAAALKGILLKLCPSATIIDVTHHITPFDIQEAAFALGNCYKEFPEGSIHLIGVNPIKTSEHSHVVVVRDGHYFIGADNGIFSLLFQEEDFEIFTIKDLDNAMSSTFPLKGVFAPVAAHIGNGGLIEEVCTGKQNFKRVNALAPVIETDSIMGLVIYIDSLGNITSNITKGLFDYVGKGRDFEISFRRAGYSITKLSANYNAVPEGEKLALFNNFNYLEIAINSDNASKLFGMKKLDTVRIDFS